MRTNVSCDDTSFTFSGPTSASCRELRPVDAAAFAFWLRPINDKNRRPVRLSFVDDPHTGCWLWRGSVKKGTGYAVRSNGQRLMKLVHRQVFIATFGPIHDDLPLDHLCRTPRCVNPLHLEPVTDGENVRRGAHTFLTPEIVSDIRAAYVYGRVGYRTLRRRFGLKHSHLQAIVAQKIWRDVT